MIAQRPITCYLDSQDYSALTDPKYVTAEQLDIRNVLLGWANAGLVKFAYSAAIICESVALTPHATHLAELKAELVYDLCGSNALVSLDRLLEMETAALANRTGKPRTMFDSKGRWFPEVLNDENPITYGQKFEELAQEDLAQSGLNRQQRRAAVRGLVKNGRPRSALKQHLEKQDPRKAALDLICRYAIKPEYAEIMARYALGRAAEHEFNEALACSLADPRWMMKWFSTEHSLSSPVADMVRKPGRELGALMRVLVDLARNHAELLGRFGANHSPMAPGGDVKNRWNLLENNQIATLLHKAAKSAGELELRDFSSVDIYANCPGVTSGIRSLFSSVWENVGGSRKELPSDSQPVDALHAFYAPYVDVFRADRFMAPHIQKHVKEHSTIVVARLSQLVDVLEHAIQNQTLRPSRSPH